MPSWFRSKAKPAPVQIPEPPLRSESIASTIELDDISIRSHTEEGTPTLKRKADADPINTTKRRRIENDLYDHIVAIVCRDGTEFAVHRGLVCSKSEYLARIFTGPERMHRSDLIDPGVFSYIKEYLYRGRLFEPPGGSKMQASPESDVTLSGNVVSVPAYVERYADYTTQQADTSSITSPAIQGNRHVTSASTKKDGILITQDTELMPAIPINSLTLTKICVLACDLEMQDVLDEAKYLLIHRLGQDMTVPWEALNYSYEEGSPDNTYNDILLLFTACHPSLWQPELIDSTHLPVQAYKDLITRMAQADMKMYSAESWLGIAATYSHSWEDYKSGDQTDDGDRLKNGDYLQIDSNQDSVPEDLDVAVDLHPPSESLIPLTP